MRNISLSNDVKRYLARAYAKATYMETSSDGMGESEYWCGMRVGIRKVLSEVFNMTISARPIYKDNNLINVDVYFDYERFEVFANDMGVFDAR